MARHVKVNKYTCHGVMEAITHTIFPSRGRNLENGLSDEYVERARACMVGNIADPSSRDSGATTILDGKIRLSKLIIHKRHCTIHSQVRTLNLDLGSVCSGDTPPLSQQTPTSKVTRLCRTDNVLVRAPRFAIVSLDGQLQEKWRCPGKIDRSNYCSHSRSQRRGDKRD